MVQSILIPPQSRSEANRVPSCSQGTSHFGELPGRTLHYRPVRWAHDAGGTAITGGVGNPHRTLLGVTIINMGSTLVSANSPAVDGQ